MIVFYYLFEQKSKGVVCLRKQKEQVKRLGCGDDSLEFQTFVGIHKEDHAGILDVLCTMKSEALTHKQYHIPHF